ncbi:carboxylesterase family protein [Umezawaea tangerina]|uniref:Carboxylesterase family protein n=2 Tax=Umezawaea tangerina TaxID=84725 RepID=A0A2T0T045_9PSEU|nr:carboxylesterase family protein [Umezawaea tangerina]
MLAMVWIPGDVTLVGVSSGAMSAAAHLVSERSSGLFRKAVLHSAFTLVDHPAEHRLACWEER